MGYGASVTNTGAKGMGFRQEPRSLCLAEPQYVILSTEPHCPGHLSSPKGVECGSEAARCPALSVLSKTLPVHVRRVVPMANG